MFYPSPVFISRRRFLPSFCGVPGWVPPLTTGSPSTGRQTDTGLSPVTIISHHQGGLGANCLSSSALILTQLEIYRRADSHVSLTLLRLKQMSNLHIFKLFYIQKSPYERNCTDMIIYRHKYKITSLCLQHRIRWKLYCVRWKRALLLNNNL